MILLYLTITIGQNLEEQWLYKNEYIFAYIVTIYLYIVTNIIMNSEFTIGTVSSLIAYTATYPIDVIKTNYQVLNYQNKNIGTVGVIKNIYKTNGLYGYYKGSSSTLLTYPIFWGMFFDVQNTSNNWILRQTNNSILTKLISPMIASTVASFVTNPLFVIKVRFQTDSISGGKSNYPNIIKNIWMVEGMRGFYKGFLSTVLNNTKLWLQFPLYDYINNKTNNIVISSVGSKFISSMLFYPTDLIRINQRFSTTKISITEASKNIFRSHGLKGFYNGLMLYNILSLPNFVLLMVIRDYLKK